MSNGNIQHFTYSTLDCIQLVLNDNLEIALYPFLNSFSLNRFRINRNGNHSILIQKLFYFRIHTSNVFDFMYMYDSTKLKYNYSVMLNTWNNKHLFTIGNIVLCRTFTLLSGVPDGGGYSLNGATSLFLT